MKESNFTIEVDSDIMESKYEALVDIRNEIDENFNGFRRDVESLKQCWTGDNGDNAYDKLIKHYSKFDYLVDRLDDFNTFLYSVKEAYVEADKIVYDIIEDNAEEMDI